MIDVRYDKAVRQLEKALSLLHSIHKLEGSDKDAVEGLIEEAIDSFQYQSRE